MKNVSVTNTPTHRIALGIEYTGARFYGWQKQPDQRTVQTELEKALARFVTKPVATICAGRTDTGVHAVSQVVHIDVACQRGEANWVRGVNSFLPNDVAVRWARKVDADFSARFSASSRTYEYWIYNDPIRSPVFDAFTGWVWRPLEADRMQEACRFLLGKHDFTSFRAADCQAATPVRTVHAISVKRYGSLICIRISADAFLQHMVRNIVGSLVYVGIGRESVCWIQDVLNARCRALAAPTFAACGLYLTGVQYPERYRLPLVGQSPLRALVSAVYPDLSNI